MDIIEPINKETNSERTWKHVLSLFKNTYFSAGNRPLFLILVNLHSEQEHTE